MAETCVSILMFSKFVITSIPLLSQYIFVCTICDRFEEFVLTSVLYKREGFLCKFRRKLKRYEKGKVAIVEIKLKPEEEKEKTDWVAAT